MDNDDGIPYADAPCVAIYRRIRSGVPADAYQLGYGYNLYPASGALEDYLRVALRHVQEHGRFAEYGTPADLHERALFAELLHAHLGVRVAPEGVWFTNGSTEAISMVMSHLANCGIGAFLPLPTYYAFEQAAARWGTTILGRYRHDGLTQTTGATTARCALVDIVPNGVTGSFFTRPASVVPHLSVVDVVFHAGRYRTSTPTTAATARDRLRGGLTDSVVLLTPSKDLCLPGIRAGALITANAALVEHVRREQFVRYATLNPLISQLMLTYLLVLLVNNAGAEGDRAQAAYDWASRRYAANHVEPMPTWRTCVEASEHLNRMSRHFATNLDLVQGEASDLLTVEENLYPAAGYSSLPRLAVTANDPLDLVNWVNACGRKHKLKLNPTVLFGGDQNIWALLYPGPRIRMNVSVPTEQLSANLSRLRHAIDTVRT